MAAIDPDSVEAMKKAIRTRDFDSFIRVLNDRRELWTSGYRLFVESRRSGQSVTLLQKLATCEYNEALQYYLHNCWQTVSVEEIKSTMYQVRLEGAAKPIMRSLLEAAINNKPQFLQIREIFDNAMRQRMYDIAERTVQLPSFETNARSKIPLQLQWHLPIHEAVMHRQTTTIELLVGKGANVNSLSNGQITPIMVACHLLYLNVVIQLLLHGSSPNFPPSSAATHLLTLRGLTKKHCADRGITPNYQNVLQQRTNSQSEGLTEDADRIIEVLIEAGLRHSNKSIDRYSTLKRYISTSMTNRFKQLDCEARPLKMLALVATRDYIRRKCRGINFFEAVDELLIPVYVKKLLTFRVRLY